MAFLDKVKEYGVKGIDKAKDLSEQAKLGIEKQRLQNQNKEIYEEIGKELSVKLPDVLKIHFKEKADQLTKNMSEIAKIEEKLAAYKKED